MVAGAIPPSIPGFVSTLRGLADGAVSLTANGAPVGLEPGGLVPHVHPPGRRPDPPRATGADGSTKTSPTSRSPRRRAGSDVSGDDRACTCAPRTGPNPAIHDIVVDLAAAGRINAVELDIKDEAGVDRLRQQGPAGHDGRRQPTGLLRPARRRSTNCTPSACGSIGRVVCFLDPVMARGRGRTAAPTWSCSTAPAPRRSANNYGAAAFTNLANPEVRQYQIDLATEAVGLGFDEILYDYVRRPEGNLAR